MNTYFFQWDIPVDNETTGRTDSYINVIATWNGTSYYNDGRPMVNVSGANLSFYDCLKVKNWFKAYSQIEKVASEHFYEIARQEKINQAGELIAVIENPITARMQAKETLEPAY